MEELKDKGEQVYEQTEDGVDRCMEERWSKTKKEQNGKESVCVAVYW